MASIRLLRGRIKSARNIAQITKAMELVAASKMKKAQAAAMAGKLYAQKIYDMVMELGERTDVKTHPLLTVPEKPTGRRIVILVSTNKGMCGGLNANLLRFLVTQYPERQNISFVAFGKKGSEFLTRIGAALSADFSSTIPFVTSVPALTDLVTSEFTGGKVDGVDIVYSEFFSALRQQPRKKTVLPIAIEGLGEQYDKIKTDFVIEPSVSEVFDELLPHYLENQLRDAMLQAEASEQSARMVAMRNATDNATSLIADLTLMYNKARQEKITYEISDLVTARLSMEE